MNSVTFTRILAASLLGIALTACAQSNRADMQRQKMTSALSPYIGKTVAEYVVEHGAPTSSVALGKQQRMFTWIIYGQTAGFSVPINGMVVNSAPQQISCTVNIIANSSLASPTLSDWIIAESKWSGAC